MYGGINIAIVTFCVSCLYIVSADIEHVCYPGERYLEYNDCGDDLSTLVNAICGFGNHNEMSKRDMHDPYRSHLSGGGGFRGILLGKRETRRRVKSEYEKSLDKIKQTNINKKKSVNKLKGLILNKRDAHSYLGGETGIVCECCYNQCDFYELAQYCSTDPTAALLGSF